MHAPDARHLERLVADGVLERREGQLRTTRRWQAALARAAYRLLSTQGDGADLRVPVASALVELYGEECPDEQLSAFVAALLPIEARELDPRVFVEPR